MKFGMTPEQLTLLESLVIQPLKTHGAEIYIFGSRVTGKHHPYSDVDLLCRWPNEKTPSGLIAQISETIEESKFPYKVDLVNDHELASSYRESVEKQLVRL